MGNLEKLENTILVLESMVFGKSFCRTENEALEDAIKYLKGLEEIYIWIKEKEINNGKI